MMSMGSSKTKNAKHTRFLTIPDPVSVKRPASGEPDVDADTAQPAVVHTLARDHMASLMTMLTSPVNRNTTDTMPDLVPLRFTRDLVAALQNDGIAVSSVKLEGSGASHVVNSDAFSTFNDIDIAIYLQDQGYAALRGVRNVLFDLIDRCLVSRTRARMMHADWPAPFVRKMWITPYTGDLCEDSWAIFTVAIPDDGTGGTTVDIDIKVLQRIARPYQFTIDSLRVDLTPLFPSIRPHAQRSVKTLKSLSAPKPPCSWADIAKARAAQSRGVEVDALVDDDSGEADVACALSYETAIDYDSVALVMDHLSKKHISVRNADELASVRGGGLLKFVGYLQKGFCVDPSIAPLRLHKYMVTRFLMDYPSHRMTARGLIQPLVLTDYLNTHYPYSCGMTPADVCDVSRKRRKFLMELHRVVSSVKSHVNLCEPLLGVITHVLGITSATAGPFFSQQWSMTAASDDSDSSSVASEDSGVSIVEVFDNERVPKKEKSKKKGKNSHNSHRRPRKMGNVA